MPTSRTAAELGAATTSAAVAAIAAMTLRTLAPYNGSLVLSRQSPDELARRLRGARDPELRRRRRGADPRREPAARAEPGRDEPSGVRPARRRAAAPRPPCRLLAVGHLLRSRRDRRALPRDGGAERRGRPRDRAPRSGSGTIQPPSRAVELWREELDGMRRHGCLFVLTMHPFLSGRPGRVEALRTLVEHALDAGDVEFVSCAEAARRARKDTSLPRRALRRY